MYNVDLMEAMLLLRYSYNSNQRALIIGSRTERPDPSGSLSDRVSAGKTGWKCMFA
jgi:hypothetical protein